MPLVEDEQNSAAGRKADDGWYETWPAFSTWLGGIRNAMMALCIPHRSCDFQWIERTFGLNRTAEAGTKQGASEPRHRRPYLESRLPRTRDKIYGGAPSTGRTLWGAAGFSIAPAHRETVLSRRRAQGSIIQITGAPTRNSSIVAGGRGKHSTLGTCDGPLIKRCL